MYRVTIVLPVSRPDYLRRIFTQLELMKCDRTKVSIFAYVDGPMTLFEKARNLVVNSKFEQRLCVYRGKGQPNVGSVKRRRKRIADIHNEIKEYLEPTDFVFLLEDDTLIPTNTLEKLLNLYTRRPYAGLISGLQIGRWGFDHLGAWRADDVYEPKQFISIPLAEELEMVDATGLYCCLTKYENYMKFNFEPFKDALGPDVAFGMYLRREGLENFVDHSIKCEHLTKRGSIKFDREIVQVKLSEVENNKPWRLERYEITE